LKILQLTVRKSCWI